MLYSSTDLTIRGMRPRTGERPVEEQAFVDANYLHRTRYWWRMDQAVAINHRSDVKAAMVRRTLAMIEAAEDQHLIIRAHTAEFGEIGYEVHDALLHECVAGRDGAGPLSLDDAELLVLSFTRAGFRSEDRPATHQSGASHQVEARL